MIDKGRAPAPAAIRNARIRAGLTQEKAAGLRGHATSTISRWETGGLPHTWAELHEYAKAIGQPITLTFGPTRKEDPRPKWARAMEKRIVSEVVANREALYAALAQDLVNAQLGRTQPPDVPPGGKRGRPPGGAGPMPKPTG